MADRQATFNLGIKTTADLSGVNELKKSLEEIQKLASNNKNVADPLRLNDAIIAANDLEVALNAAFDPDFNVVNINKFYQSLSKSEASVESLHSGLSAMGTSGVKAFYNMTSSLMQINPAIKQTSALIDKITSSFLNSLRYQVMNTAIQSIGNSISGAYGYVKKLDSSLNDIQIVSEKSGESMKEFAIQANNAAKALGASTTNYTDASLIYYQQGLSDEEVAGRTDTTIKMSNVLGTSAEKVSEYMTAIWNNFDDGSKSLEYFGDVITNLGAHTASSAEEISEGLGKFAAVANTVGLSYEYATSALATVVAETRQSADTVGTAFKTLFARIQDLELGETLDDGTTLGKYSEALAAVGINIKDMNGQLKSMDEILDEMGSKWQSLSKDTQVALAQNVAGTRQYTQLVALMENWDKVRENIDLASESTGTLNKKQAIYLNSIEAHLQQLSTAGEGLYSALLDEDTIKDFSDVLTTIVSGITKLVDALGGLGPILGSIGAVGLTALSGKIGRSLSQIISNFSLASREAKNFESNVAAIRSSFGDSKWLQLNIEGDNTQKKIISEMVGEYEKMVQYKSVMNQEDMTAYNNLQKQYTILGEVAEKSRELIDNKNISFKGKDGDIKDFIGLSEEDFSRLKSNFQEATKEYNKLINALSSRNMVGGRSLNLVEDVNKELANFKENQKLTVEELNELKIKIGDALGKNAGDIFASFNTGTLNLKRGIRLDEEEWTKFIQILKQSPNINQEFLEHLTQIYAKEHDIKNLSEHLWDGLDSALVIKNISQIAGGLSGIAMGLTQISSLAANFMDGFEISDIFTALGQLGIVIPQITNGINKISEALLSFKKVQNTAALSNRMLTKTLGSYNDKLGDSERQEINNILSKKNLTLAEKKNQIETKLSTAITDDDVRAKIADKIATESLKRSILGLKVAMGIAIVAISAVSIGFEAYRQHLQNVAEANKKAAENSAKITEHHKEEADKVRDLAEAYKDLLSSKDEMSDDELRNKSYQLCLQYDQEQLAVLALAGRYSELEEAMKGASDAANDTLAKSAETTKKAYETSLRSNLISNADSFLWATDIDYGNTLDIDGFNYINTEDAKFQEELTQAGLNFIDDWGHVTLDSLEDALINNYDGVISVLNKYKDHEGAQQLTKLISEIQSDLDGIQSAADTFKEAEESIITNSIDVDSIDNLVEYVEERTRIAEEAFNRGLFDTYEESQKWAQKQMGLIDGLFNYAKKASLLDAIIGDDSVAKAKDNLKVIEDKYDYLTKKAAETIKEKEEKPLTNPLGYFEDKQVSTVSSILTNNTGFDYFKSKNIVVDPADITPITGINTGAYINDKSFYEKRIEEAENLQAELEKTINNLDGKELDYVYNNFDQISSVSSLEGKIDAINRLKTEYERLSKSVGTSFGINLTDSIKAATEGKLTSKDIENLFESGSISEGLKNQLLRGDELDNAILLFNEQLQHDLAVTNPERQEAFKEAARLNLEGYQEELEARAEELKEKGINLVSATSDNGTSYYGASIDKASIFGGMNQDLIENDKHSIKGLGTIFDEDLVKYGKYLKDREDKLVDLNDTYEDHIQKITESTDITKEQLIKYAEANEEITIITNNTKKYVSNLEDLNIETMTSEEFQARLNDIYKETGSMLDKMQSSYKTLKEAVKEYNENGFITTDTFQSLVDLSPDMLNSLDFSANKWTINTQAIKENTLTLYDNLVSAKLMAVQGQVNAAMNNEEAAATLSSTFAHKIASLTNKELAQEIIATTNALAAQKKITNETADSIKRYVNSLQEVLKVGKASLDKNFDKAMGASSSKSSKDNKKKIEDEIDRYHDLNRAIKGVEEALDDLAAKQKYLSGKQLIKSLQQQNALLDKQKEAYQNLKEEQIKEAGELQYRLGKQFGVEFDENNEMSNYAEVAKKELEAYNAVANSTDEAAKQAAQERYDTFKKLYQKYDTTLDNIEQSDNKIRDILDTKIDNNLKEFETKIQIELDLDEARRNWKDFLKEINTDFKKQYEDLMASSTNNVAKSTTFIGDTGTITLLLQEIETAEREIDKMMAGGQSELYHSIDDAQEHLKDYSEKLMAAGKSFYDLYKETWELYLEAIDQYLDKFDDLMDKYKNIDGELEYESQLISLLYGDKAFDLINKLNAAQSANNLAQIDSLRQQAAMWKKQYEMAEEGNEDKSKFYEAWIKAQNELNDLVITEIELLQKDYLNTIDKILDKMSKTISGMSMGDLADEWDRISYEADNYLDDVEGLYKIQKLANDMQESIDNMSTVKNQQKLQALYDKEIEYLRNKENLTQYDIDAAEKKYQITLAQIALEDAQNNKNSMKLTRGTDGNWAYQYVVDPDDMNDKQQDLEDKWYDLYILAREAYGDNVEGMYSLYEQYQQKVRELNEQWMAGIYSDEDYKAKLEEMQNWYNEMIARIYEQQGVVGTDMGASATGLFGALYEDDIENYNAMTDAEKELLDTFLAGNYDSYLALEEAIKGNYDGIQLKAFDAISQIVVYTTTSLNQNIQDATQLQEAFKTAYAGMVEANGTYLIALDELQKVAGQNFRSEDGVIKMIDETAQKTIELKDETQNLVNETEEDLQRHRDNIDLIKQMWDSVKDSIELATLSLDEYLQKTNKIADSAINKIIEIKIAWDQCAQAAAAASSYGDPGEVKQRSQIQAQFYEVAGSNNLPSSSVRKYSGNNSTSVEYPRLTSGDSYSSADRFAGATINGQSYTSAQAALAALAAITGGDNNRVLYNGQAITVADAKKKVQGMATGGYTGEWSNGSEDGRLAFLHQKELVLNASDTENILAAVDGIRDLSSINSSITEAISANIAEMLMNLSGLKAGAQVDGGMISNNNSSSVYNITAEFPNANDVNSIKEAILSLPNIASQSLSSFNK